MNTTINKSILFGLGTLAMLTLGVLAMPQATHAEGGYNYNYNTFSGYNTNQYGPSPAPAPTYVPVPTPVPVYEPAPVVVAAAPTPTIYSSTRNPSSKPAPKIVATVVKKSTTDNSLAANAIFGASFLPSGLIQWVFFAILVLLLVIIVRRIYGGNEKYQAIPLKHD